VEWLGQAIDVDNVPIAPGGRMGFTIGGSDADVTLSLRGDAPQRRFIFDLPAFRGRICTATTGEVHREAGSVELASSTTEVTVHLADSCENEPTPTPPATPEARASASPDSDAGGCGCRIARAGRDASVLLCLGLAAAVGRRRRQRA
jgi:hypothetical protein